MQGNGRTRAGSPDGWPVTRYEPRPWELDSDAPQSRRARRSMAGPYEAAIPPFIAHAEPHLPASLLAEADDATVALVEFDREVGAFPLPFDAILLRTESASSSEVEQLTASAKQVALADFGAARSSNANLIAANADAMRRAMRSADAITEDAIIDIQATLLHSDPRREWITGGWRTQQVWIGGRSSPHTATFVPPHHERVPALMTDLIEFIDRDDLPTLAHAAITHAQFQTIHPFADGNGRTGRALLHATLRHSDITARTTVPVSAGLLAEPEVYFDALTAYRQGELEPIMRVIIDSVFTALGHSRRLVSRLRDVRASWDERVRARQGSTAQRSLDVLPGLPVVSIALLAETLDVSQTAASGAIDRLTDTGVLVPTSGAARNRLWMVPEVLEQLDAFAARIRRA